MIRIRLTEGGPSVEMPLDRSVADAMAASGVLNVVRSTIPGWWRLAAGTKVGVATIGDVEVWVAPKLPIRRIFFLLGYASRSDFWLDDDVELEQQPELLPAIATAFARQAERAVQLGLLQGYHTLEEASPVLRGRLRGDEQLRRRYGFPVPVEVRFDEFGVDIAENQLLRGAAIRLLRLPGLPRSTRRMLLRLLRATADVSAIGPTGQLPQWVPTRLNARYYVALRLAELVLRGGSVDQVSGGVRVHGFLVDMAKLFEDFVAVTLGEALTALAGGRQQSQFVTHLDEASAIQLRPDLVWFRSDEDELPSAVMDAKYKAEKPEGFPNADLYQMLTYCTVLGLSRGHLIYAKGNEPALEHTVRRSGITIAQHALDLDTEPVALLRQVRATASRVLEAALPSTT